MLKRIYIDLDDTIADFKGSKALVGKPFTNVGVCPMYEHGFFLDLDPVEGALSGVRTLIRMGYDVHILTQPLAESAHSYSEKAKWVGLHFPELVAKVHMTQDKGLFVGDYLIDDNANKWRQKFEANGGKFVHYGSPEFPNWEQVVKFFHEEFKKDLIV